MSTAFGAVDRNLKARITLYLAVSKQLAVPPVSLNFQVIRGA